MDAVDVLARLTEANCRVTVDGEAIRVRGGGLTDELRQAIRAHKPALLHLLRGETCASGTPGCSWPWAWKIKGQPWRCAWCVAYSAQIAIDVDVEIEWLLLRELRESLPIPPPPEERRRARERRESA